MCFSIYRFYGCSVSDTHRTFERTDISITKETDGIGKEKIQFQIIIMNQIDVVWPLSLSILHSCDDLYA